MRILAFFTDNGLPKTGLSPTIRIRDLSDDSLVITDAAMTEVGDGHYQYNFTTYDATVDYAIRCDGGNSLSNSDRYTYAGNENYYEDIQEAVWSTPVTAYSGKNMSGAMQTLIYGSCVHVDTVSGSPGTDFPIGTMKFPVDNVSDAVLIARARGIHTIDFHTDATIPTGLDASNLSFRSVGIMDTDITIEVNANVNNSAFRYLNMNGELSNGNVVLFEACTVYSFDNFRGVMNNVAFGQGSEISFNGWATVIQGTIGGQVANEAEFVIGTADVNMSHMTGNIKIKSKTGTNRTVINSDSGNINIASGCVSGSIQLLGVGMLEADNSGPNCSVDTDAFITNEKIAETVWSTPVTAYTGKNMTGAMQTLLYGNSVYIDTVNGTANGLLFPVGTLRFPCDNFADTISIARTRGITNIIINDDLNIPTGTDATDLIFMTPGYMETYVTVDAGASVDRSAFRYLNLQGEVSNGDIILVENCTIYNLANFSGVMSNVAFGEASEITLGTGSWAQIIHATAAGDAGNEPEISIGDSTLNISQLTGNLKLKDKIGTDRTTINSTSSFIIIDSTCVSGSIELIGTGGFTDNSGPNCQVDTDAFISLLTIADGVWDEQGSGHVVNGSFGKIVQDIDTNIIGASATLYNQLVTDVPGLVWEEELANHTGDGTYGHELATKADLAAATSTNETIMSSGGVIEGSVGAGTYVDTFIRDNVYWQIDETAAGLSVEAHFYIPNENRAGVIKTFGRYSGAGPLHWIDLWAYNFEADAWEELAETYMPGGQTSDALYEHEYFERHIDRSNNNFVRIRLIHNETANNVNHDLFIDYMAITSIDVITAGEIAEAVWSHNVSGHSSEDTFGGLVNLGLKRLLGLTHENVYIDTPIYDGDNNLTSARVRIYSDAGSVGTSAGVIGTYEITAPGDGPGKFTTWSQIKQ